MLDFGCFGGREVEKRRPVDTNTQSPAGSISQPVNVLGGHQANASGKIDLNADVNRGLKGRRPRFGSWWRECFRQCSGAATRAGLKIGFDSARDD